MSYNRKICVVLSTDILNKGYISIPKIANKYGDVIMGLLIDTKKEKKIPRTQYK